MPLLDKPVDCTSTAELSTSRPAPALLLSTESRICTLALAVTTSPVFELLIDETLTITTLFATPPTTIPLVNVSCTSVFEIKTSAPLVLLSMLMPLFPKPYILQRSTMSCFPVLN